MSTRRTVFLCILLGLAIEGCVTTQIYTKANPDYAGYQYQRILIKFTDLQPAYSAFGEGVAQAAITLNSPGGVATYVFSNEFYTGVISRQELAAQIHQFEMNKKIDALLICASNHGRQADYAQDKDLACRMELFDLRTGQSVWYSQGRLDTNSTLFSFQDLLKTFIEKSVADLQARNVLGKDTRPDFVPSENIQRSKSEI